MNSIDNIDDQAEATCGRSGFLMGLTAYIIWGSFPVYFKALVHVSASEVLAQDRKSVV